MREMMLMLIMMTSLVQGVQGQTMNERNIGIIVGAIGGAIIIVLVVLICCVVCRPKDRRRKQASQPTVFVNGGVYGNGTLPIGKPGVWTTNPTFFVGVPSPAYSATAGKKPVLAYRHSVAGRPYNGYTHLNTDKRNAGLPIYSQPDLRANFIMEERRKQGILVDSNSSMVRAYSDYNGNKPLGAPGERYVAKVYSGYGDLNSHGNVARVYSNYSTPDLRMTSRNPIYSEGHVARAVVRQRDGTLDRIDEYSDVAASTPAVHMAHKNVPTAQLNRPVTRTQSYQDRSPTRHLRPGSLIRPNAPLNDVQPTANGRPGHKPIDRSSSDAYAHANRRLERKPMDEPHSKVSRSRSADQQVRALPKLPQAQTEVDSSVKDNFTPTDTGRDVHSHIYASLGEATNTSTPRNAATNVKSNSLQGISITEEEDPSALYALPMKVKRPQTEGGSGRSKVNPEAQSPSPPPPPPPPPLRPLSESKRESPRNSVVNSLVKSLEASAESKKEKDNVRKESPKQSPPKTSPKASPKPVSPKDSKPKVLPPTKASLPKESAQKDIIPLAQTDIIPLAQKDIIPLAQKDIIPLAQKNIFPLVQKDIIPLAPKEAPVTKAPSPDLQTTKLEIKDEPKLISQPEKTVTTKTGDVENVTSQKLESDSESVTYANAGEQVTNKAFEFLDNYTLDDSASVISNNNVETTSLTGFEITDKLFCFLDSYPDVTCDTFGADAHGSFSSSSQETIVQNPITVSDTTPDILIDHGTICMCMFGPAIFDLYLYYYVKHGMEISFISFILLDNLLFCTFVILFVAGQLGCF